MQINATRSARYEPVGNSENASKMKQLFQQLGSALESGDLSAAKEAFAQLQKNAPAAAGKRSDPIGAKMSALGKALESGDLKSAQTAYSDVKQALTQRPSGSGKARGAGGPPPGGGGGGKAASTSSSSSSSSKIYDPKDANKDGTVSWKEEQDYSLKHPEATEHSSKAKSPSESGSLDVLA